MPSNSFGPDGFGVGDVRASGNNSSALGTFRCIRSKQFSHGGSTFTRSVHVSNDFGVSRAGGAIYFMMHGWVNEYYLGIMRWHNAGGSGGIISAEIITVDSRGFTVTATHDSDQTVTFNVSGAHSNAHGFHMMCWNGF
jgi:hypothetical protein